MVVSLGMIITTSTNMTTTITTTTTAATTTVAATSASGNANCSFKYKKSETWCNLLCSYVANCTISLMYLYFNEISLFSYKYIRIYIIAYMH